MKKIVCRFAVAFSTLSHHHSSCTGRESTNNIVCQKIGTLQDETAAKLLVDYLNGACGGYFAEEHSYTGLSADATRQASNEFRTNCLALDEERITHYYLAPGENVVIYLIEKKSGSYVDYCGWVNTDEPSTDDEDTH